MHKELNLFEYELTKDKKIELNTIQISKLLNDIFNDFDYFKYELEYHFKDILDKYLEDNPEKIDKYLEDNPERIDKYLEDNPERMQQYLEHNPEIMENKIVKIKRVPASYNSNESIKNLFNKYHIKGITKKKVFQQIATELSITFKAVEKAYYKKSK